MSVGVGGRGGGTQFGDFTGAHFGGCFFLGGGHYLMKRFWGLAV